MENANVLARYGEVSEILWDRQKDFPLLYYKNLILYKRVKIVTLFNVCFCWFLLFLPGKLCLLEEKPFRSILRLYPKSFKSAKIRKVAWVLVTKDNQFKVHCLIPLFYRYASICQAAGLVPIVEPEVLCDGDHTLGKH